MANDIVTLHFFPPANQRAWEDSWIEHPVKHHERCGFSWTGLRKNCGFNRITSPADDPAFSIWPKSAYTAARNTWGWTCFMITYITMWYCQPIQPAAFQTENQKQIAGETGDQKVILHFMETIAKSRHVDQKTTKQGKVKWWKLSSFIWGRHIVKNRHSFAFAITVISVFFMTASMVGMVEADEGRSNSSTSRRVQQENWPQQAINRATNQPQQAIDRSTHSGRQDDTRRNRQRQRDYEREDRRFYREHR